MVRIVFAVVLLVSVFNSASQAVIDITMMGSGGGVSQYAKTLLNEKLTELAKEPGQCDLAVCLNISPELKDLGAEGYKLEVKKGDVSISAASERGVLYGAVAFIEWVIKKTSPYLIDSNQVDIDFAIEPGQAKEFLNNLPNYSVAEKSFYSLRGVDMQLALGAADLIDTDKANKFVSMYSGVPGGFKDSCKEWKEWCDWLGRHRMNYISNWPYSCGTNWWELAYDPCTANMTQYSAEEIKKAAVIREELLKYAKDRGVKPYLMNYVLGAPNPVIIKNYPEFIGPRARPEWPAAFCMSSPGLKEKFEKQIRAIVKAYPSLGGFHLRWWGESFPCSCAKCNGKWQALLQDYTLGIINTALEERPDLDIRITGWIRCGGNKEFADKLPSSVIIQTKWGIDWEPSSHPDVPYERISEVKQRFMISQCVPGEEVHPIGCIQYKGLEVGIRQYTMDRAKFPNLEGFAMFSAEKDHEWITGLNMLSAAKLNWDPAGTDVNGLAKNYISSALRLKPADAEISENIWRALDLTQDLWESYCVDFGGVTKYYDCYRFHDLFGLERAKKLSTESLNKALGGMSKYSETMQKAMGYMVAAQKSYTRTGEPKGQVFLDDVVIQTEVFEKYFRSRELMTKAFISFNSKDYDTAGRQLQKMKELDQQLLQATMKKPNISDDYEFEGMDKPFHMNERVDAEIKEIDKMMEDIMQPSQTWNAELLQK